MIVQLDRAYKPSGDVIARVIEDEIIIVPLVDGIGDMEDELYTLNETGRAIWDKLDGQRTLAQVVTELSEEFDGDEAVIREDVVGLVTELCRRRMLEPVEARA